MSVKIKQGDCLELIQEIPDESIDLLLTDIPFNISKSNNFKTMKDRNGRYGIDFGAWDKDFSVMDLKAFVPKLKKGGSIVIFHAFEQYTFLKTALEEEGLETKDRMVWKKTNPMPRNRDRRYISNIEMISWYVKKGNKWTFHRQHENYDGCVLEYPSESGGGYTRYHPCQKNVKMLEELIKRHSNENDVVFDPYMGSGSTGVACINTSRNFIGYELDGGYFDIASKRLTDKEMNGVIREMQKMEGNNEVRRKQEPFI